MSVKFFSLKPGFYEREVFSLYFFLSLLSVVFGILNAFIYTKSSVYFLLKDEQVLKKLIIFLKKCGLLRFELLVDLVCIDYVDHLFRFELVYNLLSVFFNFRIFLKLNVFHKSSLPYGQGIESVGDVFNSAGWLEREVWDMFGIFFFNHKDLRRILTDYGFMGFPLRKDFPLMGFKEIRYDDFVKRVIQEAVQATQVYRVWGLESAW